LPRASKKAQGKLGTRGLIGVCLGVDSESKAWRMLDPDNMKVRVTRNVRFLEHLTLGSGRLGRPGTRLQAGREVEVLKRSQTPTP